MRNTLQDSNVAGKIDAGDKERLEKMVQETIDWLDHNQVRAGCWRVLAGSPDAVEL